MAKHKNRFFHKLKQGLKFNKYSFESLITYFNIILNFIDF